MHDDWGTRSERWAGVRSERVDVRGTSVHVLRSGDDQPGLPLLLVHGLAGSAANWLEVLPTFAAGRPVVAPDLPGFGRTQPPRPNGTRVGGNAQFLRALLAELGWDRVEVHGNSMGGMISVLLADLVPEAVQRLVLSSPALPASARAVARMDRSTVARFGPFLVPSFGERMLARTYERTTPRQLYDDTLAYVMADPARLSPELTAVGLENVEFGRQQPWRRAGLVAATASLVRMVVGRRFLERAVSRISCPTLVVWGDRDRLIGRPVIDRIRAVRPDWVIEVIEGVGHAPMMEAPDQYLEIVDAWHSSGAREPSTP